MIPPKVYCHHRLILAEDLERELLSIGNMGYSIVTIQPAEIDAPSKTLWVTSVKVENYRQRLIDEEEKKQHAFSLFGPYYNPDMDSYKNT